MDADPVAHLLAEAGYRVSWRRDGFTECLVSLHDERWRGVGADDREALDDALLKAFPSDLSQKLLRAELEARAQAAIVARPSMRPVPPMVPPPSVPPARGPRAVSLPPPPALPREFSPPSRAPEPPSEEPPRPAAAPTDAAVRSAERAQGAQAPAPARDDSDFQEKLQAALDDLQALRKRIDADLEELALSTPTRQRAVMLGWIASARAQQEALHDAPAVFQAVASIAQTLTGLCKRWWPGSVRALQVSCQPRDVASDLPVRVYEPIFSWADAERVVATSLDELIRQEEANRRDAYGWADGHQVTPAPHNPASMQAELQAAIEQHGGALGMTPAREPVPDPAKFLVWCRTLRWLRGSTPDVARWGLLAGRLRWWAQTHPAKLQEGQRVLDPTFVPEASWSVVLGKDKKDLARRKLIKEVFQGAPAAREAPTDAHLIAWLARALPLGDTHHGNIVDAMKPFRERVNALESGQFPQVDRRLRRRLAMLQRDLGGSVSDESLSDTVDDAPEPPGPEVLEELALGAMASMPSAMREAVVQRTEGKTALFVSNRNDPMLHDKLVEILRFRELVWSECEPRRCAAIESTIAAQKYDFVFGATGFFSHSVDGLLTRACRRGGVPYIRVDRGRPLACVRALSRELGLDEAHHATA